MHSPLALLIQIRENSQVCFLLKQVNVYSQSKSISTVVIVFILQTTDNCHQNCTGMSYLNNIFLLTWPVQPSEVCSSFGIRHSPYTFNFFPSLAVKLGCSGRVCISCCTAGICHVTSVKHRVISRWVVIITKGTFLFSFW